jgi:hypothetical protein
MSGSKQYVWETAIGLNTPSFPSHPEGNGTVAADGFDNKTFINLNQLLPIYPASLQYMKLDFRGMKFFGLEISKFWAMCPLNLGEKSGRTEATP